MYQLVFDILLAGALAAPTPGAPTTGAPAPEGVARHVPQRAQAQPGTTALPPGPDRPVAGFGAQVPLALLDAARGGSEGVVSHSELGGQVANNSASQLSTGANSIASGSLAGAVGLPVVIQNSGANVLIQNSTIVNVQFK